MRFINRIFTALVHAAKLLARSGLLERFRAPRMNYAFVCYAPDGSVRWAEEFHNVVTKVGLSDLINKYFNGAGYTAAWFVGLISSVSYTTGPDDDDTANAHPGWTEGVPYSDPTRPALTLGAAVSGVADNSAAKATFHIDANHTVKGAFVISNNTKGGTSGTLYSAGLFVAGDRLLQIGDQLDVTVTVAAA